MFIINVKFLFEHIIPLPCEVVFGFHANPKCLAMLHANWCNMEVLAHEPQVRVGGEIWIEQTVMGFIPVVLGFRHHIYEQPFCFGEELIHGPFSKFIHIHEFVRTKNHTVVRDHLEMDWPWQFGGDLIFQKLVIPQLRKAFHYRALALDRLALDGTMERHALPPPNQTGDTCL